MTSEIVIFLLLGVNPHHPPPPTPQAFTLKMQLHLIKLFQSTTILFISPPFLTSNQYLAASIYECNELAPHSEYEKGESMLLMVQYQI